MRTSAALIISIACGGCATAVDLEHFAQDPIAVEVWTGGDDGLTQRLADAVRIEFSRSARFTKAPPSASNALRATIPTHVGSDEVGGRTRVSYAVVFDFAERRMEGTSGVCWSDELGTCARLVVQQATAAVAR